MSSKIKPDIPIQTRGIKQIESGSLAVISYVPINGKQTSINRDGIINEINFTGERVVKFQFYDETKEREIEVTIGSTTGESKIRSRKDDRWTALGTPLRVGLSEDAGEFSEYVVDMVPDHIAGQYGDIVAAAAVKWNSQILKWFNQSEENV